MREQTELRTPSQPPPPAKAADAILNRRVLVTGISRGLGSVLVEELHAHGYQVYGLGAAREDVVPRTIRDRLHAYVAVDLALLAELSPSEPPPFTVELDAVVNNAAIRSFGPFQNWDWAEGQRVAAVNYLAAMRLAHWYVPGMLARGYGRIINIASKSAVQPSVNGAFYNSSKAALVSFTQCLARDLGETGRNVTANVICPGAFRAGRGAEALPPGGLTARIAARVARLIESDENAQVIYEVGTRERMRLAAIHLSRAVRSVTG
jgi:NAD(P)-dependent dehydrogenase (short-subunit alcohol dehydrogenase family)